MPEDMKVSAAELKVPLAVVPLRALKGPSRVYQYGGRRYALGNYINATLLDGAPERYIGGALRHLSMMQAPGGLYTRESIAARDVESGLPELDHMICGLLMLRDILIKEGVLPEDPGFGSQPPRLKEDPCSTWAT